MLELFCGQEVVQDDLLFLRVEHGVVPRGFHLLDEPAADGLVLDVEELHGYRGTVGLPQRRDDVRELHLGTGKNAPCPELALQVALRQAELRQCELFVGMRGLRVVVLLLALCRCKRVEVRVQVTHVSIPPEEAVHPALLERHVGGDHPVTGHRATAPFQGYMAAFLVLEKLVPLRLD
jgi:hypothetical protein